jgi:phosphoglucosamine mutase
MHTNTKLFGTDGIRGIAGQPPLTPDSVARISRCAAAVLHTQIDRPAVHIGWDTRASCRWIAQILIREFRRQGFAVTVAEILPTPGIAFLCRTRGTVGAVISASHNPYEFNGIKFLSPEGTKIDDDVERAIEERVASPGDPAPRPGGTVSMAAAACREAYAGWLLSHAGPLPMLRPDGKPLRIAVDCANGAAGPVARMVFPRITPHCRLLNTTPTGTNINARCGALYPNELRKRLRAGTIGITLDGDADRTVLVDEERTVRDGDFILAILSADLRRRGRLPQGIVVPTVMSNLGLLRHLRSRGIKTILAPVGDKNVYAYMRKYRANLGGEQSGHIIINDLLPTGDGMLTAIASLRAVADARRSLAALCSVFTKYPQVLLNLETEDKPPVDSVFPPAEIRRLEKRIAGRVFIRYSGTEPLLRIMAEGRNRSAVERAVRELAQRFRNRQAIRRREPPR